MTLQFTGNWEHALLAATVQAAAKKPQHVGYLGRTALQKILYFLQTAGVPMSYRFDIYHYGPYCDRISRDVEWLLADGVLKDTSQKQEKYSNYRPDTAASDLVQLHAEAIKLHLETIEKVVHALLPLQPDHLELLATLDYLYRLLKAGGGRGPWKDQVIERFLQVKKDKFPRSKVVEAYDSMVSGGLLEA